MSESRISRRNRSLLYILRSFSSQLIFPKTLKRTLIYAVRLAQRNNSSLILFHVFEPPEFVRQLPQDYSYESNEEMRKLFDAASRQSEERLVKLSRDVQGSNVKIETSQCLGTPYEEIVKFAKEKEVDLIVIAPMAIPA